MEPSDLNLSHDDMMIRLLGRLDVITEIEPLVTEAAELTDRLRALPAATTIEAHLLNNSFAVAQLSAHLAKMCAWAESANRELKGELALLKAD